MDRRYRLRRVIAVLSELSPDVALLQEVAAHMPRSRFHDQAGLLSDALGMRHTAYRAEHHASRGGYGNAIISRWPLYDVQHVDLTIGTHKKRGALQAKARVGRGRRTRTVVLHSLHLGLTASERGLQLERLLASHPIGDLHSRIPVVLGGDLNDMWGTLGPSFLLPAGFSRAGPLTRTFPAWLPVRPLDGLFVRGDIRVRRTGAVRGALARRNSDHLPLSAELELLAR